MSSDYASGPRFTAYDHDHPAAGRAVIRTRSGLWLDLLDPRPEAICADDIAYGLAHVCRFGGQLPAFYSVAEHSIGVAAMLHRQYGDHTLTVSGLMHDAAEAYAGDMVRPLKQHLQRFHTIEGELLDAIAEAMALPPAFWADDRIKAADEAMLVFEMANVRDNRHREPAKPALVARRFLAMLGGDL